MQKITATFRIVTPMFIAGADQQIAELRAPSIKGALRFWWRALNWSRIRAGKDSNEAALKELARQEATLFGDADKKGQSQVLISVSSNHTLKSQIPSNLHSDLKPQNNNPNSMAGARYLGFGVIVAFTSNQAGKQAGQLERACIDPEQTFTVRLASKQAVDDSILDALKMLGLLGGIGSRTRRGYGSIMLEKIERVGDEGSIWEAPPSKQEYKSQILEILNKYHSSSLSQLPPISAFYRDSRIDMLLHANSSYKVLNQLGLHMLDYRSWGRTDNGNRLPLPSGMQSEERFPNDHDWYREKNNGWRDHHHNFHPQRAVFGLPHNYGQEAINHVSPSQHERRGSPLLFHVHKIGNDYLGVAIFLKSRFLPKGEGINAGGENVPANIEWSVITDFLDGKKGNPPGPQNRFPHKEVIFP